MKSLRRGSLGFTLIEVLIVIIVIAILAGILLPVFTNAKAQSRRCQCASNLQQLGRAFDLYLSDWNGIYPAPGGLFGNYNYWSQSGDGGLVGYVDDAGGVGTVWCCPELTEWDGRYAARTYGMNSYLRNPPDLEYPGCIGLPQAWQGCPQNFLEEPRRTILLYEGIHRSVTWPEGQDYLNRCGTWDAVSGAYDRKFPKTNTMNSWRAWHGTMNNYLYCDGHIRTFTPEKKRPPYDLSNQWYVRKSYMAKKYGGWN